MDEDDLLNQIQHYIDIGAIRFAGYDEYGEALFELNEEMTMEKAPELWIAHEEYVEDALLSLLERDLMHVEYNENLEATMIFSEEGYEVAKKMGVVPIEDL